MEDAGSTRPRCAVDFWPGREGRPGRERPRRGLLRAQACFLRRCLCTVRRMAGPPEGRWHRDSLGQRYRYSWQTDIYRVRGTKGARPQCTRYSTSAALPSPPPRGYAELYTEGGLYIREIHTGETVRRSPCCASSPRKHGGTVPPRLPHTMNRPCTIGRPGGPASAARAGARGRSPCQIPSPPPAPSPPPPAPSAPIVSGTGNGLRDPAFLDEHQIMGLPIRTAGTKKPSTPSRHVRTRRAVVNIVNGRRDELQRNRASVLCWSRPSYSAGEKCDRR